MGSSRDTAVVFIIGYGGQALPVLRRVVVEEGKVLGFRGYVISEHVAGKYVDVVKSCDAIFLYCSRLPDEVVNAVKSSRAKLIISASDSYAELARAPPEVAERAIRLWRLGGEVNLRNLLHLILREVGYDVEVGEAQELPWHGIYHPDLGVYASVEQYLRDYRFRNRALVGILFYRGYWLYGQLDFIDELVRALEEEGLGVVPVFTYGFKLSSELPDAEDSIREFFLLDGRPVVDAVINLKSFFILRHGRWWRESSRGFSVVEGTELLKKLDVPVIQLVMDSYRSVEEWLQDPQGVSYFTQVYQVIMPEVDGAVEPIFYAGSRVGLDGVKKYEVFREHLRYVARRIRRWIELRRKPPSQRRIAIVLINPPCKSLEANVAVGLGLDVPESVVRLLRKLKELGYDVGDYIPRDGNELIKLIMSRKAISEFRWTSVEDIVRCGGALDFVDAETYMKWFSELPEDVREEMIREWGDPLDVLEGRASRELVGMVYEGKFVIPGIRFGNIVLVPQPKFGCAGPACDGKVCKVLHNPTIKPPHQWLAVYRWLSRVFKADVIIHFGTHGTLEFRPGKGVGLSPACWPEISIDDVPHLYVYVVSNPMEGVIAKRRSYAVLIDHMYPPMAMADVLGDLEHLLNEYSRAKQLGEFERAKVIYDKVTELARRYNIVVRGSNPDEVIEEIHRYCHMGRGTQVNLGLHVFGNPPLDLGRLAEYVATAMAYDTPKYVSIRRVLAKYLRLNYDELRSEPGKLTPLNLTPAEVLDTLHKLAVGTLRELLKAGHTPASLSKEVLTEVVNRELSKLLSIRELSKLVDPSVASELLNAFKVALDIAGRIAGCVKEYDGLITGISGGYVEPGPSGALTRGKVEVLPTGRNFYAIDPTALPTQAAWRIGVETAEKLLKYYLEKHGRYPETVGVVLWSVDAYKADGEQLAQVLYLLGVRPVWDSTGAVRGIEVIPLEELGRPRIDVTVRISGIVRDTLPNYIYLIDEAVSKVASLNEPPEKNFVRKHYLEYLRKLLELGRGFSEADELARARIFGAPPGAYGAGVNYAVEASAWRSDEDLAKVWVQWGSYIYSRKSYGKEAPEALILNLKKVDVVARNHVSDEHDIFGCCCYFAYHGGFYGAVKALTGRNDVEVVTVDTRDISSTEVRGMKDEVERIVRAKLLNPVWISEMKKHGYRGASEFQRRILHLYGWSATTKLVDDWVFEEIAKTYVLDEEMRKWFIENNVWALEEIARRLIEATERGLWRAPEEMLEELREAYGEIEGVLEDSIGGGEVQGGAISIYTAEDVSEWKSKLRKIEEVLKRLT